MEKDSTISIIRLIAFLMIISCHILQGMENEAAYWVNLGVQVFFFISGYLYGKKEIVDYKKFYKSRLAKILLPTTIIIVIMLIIEKIFLNITYSKFYIISNLLGFSGFSTPILTLTHTWFISYILICYLITPILQSLFKNNKHNLQTLLLIITTLILFRNFNVISINHIWIINYIFGYFFSKCCNTAKERNRFFIVIFALAIFMLPLTLILRYDLITDIPANILRWETQIWDWEHVFLGCSLYIILYKILSVLPIKYNAILKFSDKYSFFIYLTHQIFILNNLSVLNLTDSLIVNILLIYLLSILSGIALYYIYHIFYAIMNFFTKHIFRYI